jgi:hypothetical protein
MQEAIVHLSQVNRQTNQRNMSNNRIPDVSGSRRRRASPHTEHQFEKEFDESRPEKRQS